MSKACGRRGGIVVGAQAGKVGGGLDDSVGCLNAEDGGVSGVAREVDVEGSVRVDGGSAGKRS